LMVLALALSLTLATKSAVAEAAQA
jgi:hypothetical protein